MRIQPVGFDLRIGNEPCLGRMSQHHLFNLIQLFQLVVNQTPIPAGLHYRLARTFQAPKKLSETTTRIALYPGFTQLAASLV